MRENHGLFVLGVDLGGSKILTAVITSQWNVLARDYRVTPADKGPEAVIRAMLKSAGRATDVAGIAIADLSAIGIGAPGIINPETGVVFTSPHLPGWQNVPLRDIIERESGKKRESNVFPWVKHLSEKAEGEFHKELFLTFEEAMHSKDWSAFEETLSSWVATAEAMTNPEMLELITTDLSKEEFTRVG